MERNLVQNNNFFSKSNAGKLILTIAFLSVVACSSSAKKQTAPEAQTKNIPSLDGLAKTLNTEPAAATPVAPTNPHDHSAQPEPKKETEIQIAKPAEHSSGHDMSQMPMKMHQQHHAPPKGADPEKAYGWLKNGNTRFLKGKLRNDGQSKSDIHRLSTGQNPHTIVLSCSDSRVPPEVVFDQKLGEIFVVRTAGEALDPNAIGSIEYAVSHLGTKLILVMGHTSCGAVKAALGTMNGEDAGSPSLNHLVADLHPRLMKFKNKAQSQNVSDESLANAQGVASDLVARSKIIHDMVQQGSLKIKFALYHLDSGKVEFE